MVIDDKDKEIIDNEEESIIDDEEPVEKVPKGKPSSAPRKKVSRKAPPPKANPLVEVKGRLNWFFSSYLGIIFTGAFIGVIATFLQKEGNPGNMGFCIACFERDIAGALGLHNAAPVQYMRPEIIGIILGSLVASMIFGEWRSRGGSAPMIRFVLGFFAMMGALVFLGCPWRAFLRLAGGDWNAILGILGLFSGVLVGAIFIRMGFNMGRSQKQYPHVGLMLPLVMLSFLIMMVYYPTAGDARVIRESAAGPGAAHAALGVSLAAGLMVGFFAQRTRFCTIGGMRDTILIRDYYLLIGVIALVVSAFLTNYFVYDQWNPGWEDQPLAHSEGLWNFSGMLLAGLAFVLAGGCPGRQVILSGEGDSDAATFVIGMIAAGAFAHNFQTVSAPAFLGGVNVWGPNVVGLGLIVCVIIGLTMREKY